MPGRFSLSRPESRLPPTTRYQGSKRKLLPWLWQHLQPFEFQTVLDAFGGTGAVSYYLKSQGKTVTYNDYLRFNHIIGLALIENSHTQLHADEIDKLQTPQSNFCYQNFITQTFPDIYFTPAENQWLDLVVQNITHCLSGYARSIAYYALFQACLIKRPYNLFHRRNLYMRTADVSRSFGNKATWDRTFAHYFKQFIQEANQAILPGDNCQALCGDVLSMEGKFDLLYIDPPYISAKGQVVDYQQFYHFLEGLTDYAGWQTFTFAGPTFSVARFDPEFSRVCSVVRPTCRLDFSRFLSQRRAAVCPTACRCVKTSERAGCGLR